MESGVLLAAFPATFGNNTPPLRGAETQHDTARVMLALPLWHAACGYHSLPSRKILGIPRTYCSYT